MSISIAVRGTESRIGSELTSPAAESGRCSLKLPDMRLSPDATSTEFRVDELP